MGRTKSGKARTIDLSPRAAALFQEWTTASGGVVFEKETGGYLDSAYAIRRVLSAAKKRAGVPRRGEHGRNRTFHSFRHVRAHHARERRRNHLGERATRQQSINLTVDIYNRWGRTAPNQPAITATSTTSGNNARSTDPLHGFFTCPGDSRVIRLGETVRKMATLRESAGSVRWLEDAAVELHSLRRLIAQRASLAIAATTLVLPVAAVNTRLAFALAVGALAEGILTFEVMIRRRDRLLELASRRDAYALPDVRHFGILLAAPRQRRAVARSITALLRDPGGGHALFVVDRVAAAAPRLAAIAEALSDTTLVIEPVAMATLLQLLTNGETSPLLNPSALSEELDGMVAAILSGIRPRLAPGDQDGTRSSMERA